MSGDVILSLDIPDSFDSELLCIKLSNGCPNYSVCCLSYGVGTNIYGVLLQLRIPFCSYGAEAKSSNRLVKVVFEIRPTTSIRSLPLFASVITTGKLSTC